MYFKIHGLYFSQQAMCFFRRPMKSFLHHKKRVYFLTQKTRNSFPAPRIPIIRKTSQQQKSPPFTQFTFRPRKLSAKLQRFLGISIFHAERFFLICAVSNSSLLLLPFGSARHSHLCSENRPMVSLLCQRNYKS